MLQVTNSPFQQEQVDLLNKLIPTLTEGQRIWLSGYLSALPGAAAPAPAAAPGGAVQAAAVTAAAAPAASAPAAPREATVLYGSQTGNSQKLAKKLAGKLQEQGIQVALSSMNDFKPNTLKKVQQLFIVVSTHGEGDPPDNAISFYEFLHSKRAPKLDGMPFSVLALGDTSYEQFCKTGKDFDARLEELGGKRLAPRVDCDVDFEEPAEQWMKSVLEAVAQASGAAPAPAAGAGAAAAASAAPAAEPEYSRSRPFPATVLENLNLNGRGSARETRHVELSLEGSNLRYEPGDSLGVYPENHPRLVEELIAELGLKPDDAVALPKTGETVSLREALASKFEITVLTKPLIEQAAQLFGSSGLKELLAAGREQELREYIKGRDLLDLVQDYRLKGASAQELTGILRKMPPRLYSIASSPTAFPDEVHLTVRKVAYESHGRMRYGVCSTHLSERLEIGDTLPVFVQENPNFKLPSDPDTPIIMIGPGTGVAPFRAFLGEREETGASGKTWLFYGDQRFSTDFLYQIEWQRWLKEGVLTRMDVAFSRDTDRKVYVQHRMLEQSKELYRWLEDGAVVYVCGDEKKMAHDVHATLTAILRQEGGMSEDAAAAYLSQMQQEKRYQRDVY